MLRFTRQSLYIPLMTVGFLLVMLAAGEAFVRSPFFQSRTMAPTLNSVHRQFEWQWQRLKEVAQQDGKVDCIVLGNSMVVSGFDPIAFADAYAEQTGERLQCVNFGVDAIPTATAGALAKILVDEYQPRLLIYGTSARDLAVSRNDYDTTVILDLPWLQHKLGNFNPEGWLLEHSVLYRSRRLLYNLSRLSFRDTLRSYYGPPKEQGRLGYDPVFEATENVAVPPDPSSGDYQVQYNYGLLANYKILPENRAGLELLLQQQGEGSQLLLVEMPVPDTYFDFYDDAGNEYRSFLDSVGEAAERHSVPFWQTVPLRQIPLEGWMDYTHMNAQGATIFSTWLGKEVGEAVQSGELALGGENGQ
jgi:hypothetical protein